MSSKRAAATALVREEDARRPKSAWEKLDKPSLVLKCNSYNLSEAGTKEVLVKRLVSHFREPPSESDEDVSTDTNPYYESSDNDVEDDSDVREMRELLSPETGSLSDLDPDHEPSTSKAKQKKKEKRMNHNGGENRNANSQSASSLLAKQPITASISKNNNPTLKSVISKPKQTNVKAVRSDTSHPPQKTKPNPPKSRDHSSSKQRKSSPSPDKSNTNKNRIVFNVC